MNNETPCPKKYENQLVFRHQVPTQKLNLNSMITKNFLFLVLLACVPSHLIAECIGTEKFQTCADKNGIISSVNETGLHNSFPEASQGDSDWEKKLKAIRMLDQSSRDPTKTDTPQKTNDNRSILEINPQNCLTGPLGNTCLIQQQTIDIGA